jgi:glycosyltransferase involved in cell wall biosynthesis
MKVLFVLHQYLPRHVTGTEQYARSLALGLRSRGHEVEVFAFEPRIQFEVPGQPWFERDEVVEGVPVHRVSVHPEFAANRELGDFENPIVAGMFARWLAKRQFDVVHVFHARNIGSVALTEPRGRGMKVVVHLMDFWFLCPNFLLLHRSGSLCEGPPEGGFGCMACLDPALDEEVRALELRPELLPLQGLPPPAAGPLPTAPRRAQALLGRKDRLFALLADADAVIAPSRFLRAKFVAAGLPARRVQHLPYGLDPARFGAVQRDAPPGARPELHIGYVGSMSRHKGVHVLIEAVARSRLPVRLHLHGGLESHPEYSAELRALAADDPRVEFHGRFEPAQLGEVLAQLDCLVVPSLWYENTPFSALEALHYGLPVVASDLGGIAEVVAAEQNGLLVPHGDAQALAAALARLDRDRELVRRLAAGAKVPHIADNLVAIERVYAQVVATGAQPR